MKNEKRNAYVTRETSLKLLSDDETARVSVVLLAAHRIENSRVGTH